jgi:GNAT superfamily N-acetyltransferase
MAADPDLIALFARSWAITRGVAPPVPRLGGHYIQVGQPDQKARYVFADLDKAVLVPLAQSIEEHWVYLKICAAPERVRPLLPPQWVIREPATYIMTTILRSAPTILPEDYALEFEPDGSAIHARIIHAGVPVARGRIVWEDDTVLFDRISTDDAHRRKGLGRAVMQGLSAMAFDRGHSKGLLAATEMGRSLYASLGWIVHAPYTSAVIPC